MSKKKKSKSELKPVDVNRSNQGNNKYDFLIHLVDILYNLATFKKLSCLIILAIVFCAMIFALKESMNDFFAPWYDALNFIDNKLEGETYSTAVTLLFSVSLLGNFLQRIIYKKEINRIAKSREEVIHGIKTGEMRTIEIHNSSSSTYQLKEGLEGQKSSNDITDSVSADNEDTCDTKLV